MDTSKLKNIIIIMLAVLDLCLISLLAADRFETARVQRGVAESVAGVLAAHGITMSDDVSLDASAPEPLRVVRDTAAEQAMVETLLGPTDSQDQGGNIYSYYSSSGQARFRGTGEFEILLNYGVVESGRDRVHTAKKTLARMGFDSANIAEKAPETSDTVIISLNCVMQGGEVFNARVEFIFSGEHLLFISGQRLFDTAAEASGQSAPMDAATMLVRFLESASASGYVCSEITDIRPGYVMSVPVTGESTLTPVWKIETDTGNYFINGLTGKAETVD